MDGRGFCGAGLRHGFRRHHFQSGDPDQRTLERQAQAAHEGQAHSLTSKGARTHGHRQALERGKFRTRQCHRLLHHRGEPFGMTAVHGFENMGADIIAIHQRDRTGAKRGIDSQQGH